MKRWSGIALAVVFVAGSLPAGADVLCRKKNGALASRSACKGKETQVNPASLGLVGPPGQKGDQGDQGNAGPGARWAYVDSDGTILDQSGGISFVMAASSTGFFVLDFGSSQAGKNIQVTSTCSLADCSFRGGTSGVICGGTATGVYDCGLDPTINNDSHVGVFTRNSADNGLESHAFYVSVF